ASLARGGGARAPPPAVPPRVRPAPQDDGGARRGGIFQPAPRRDTARPRLDAEAVARVGHLDAVDPERPDGDGRHRPLVVVRVHVVGAHDELPGRDRDHLHLVSPWAPARRRPAPGAGPGRRPPDRPTPPPPSVAPPRPPTYTPPGGACQAGPWGPGGRAGGGRRAPTPPPPGPRPRGRGARRPPPWSARCAPPRRP